MPPLLGSCSTTTSTLRASRRSPRLFASLSNSGNDISAFEGALSGLEGAHRTLENGVLQTTHQLIGPSSLEHDMYQPMVSKTDRKRFLPRH